MIAIKLNYYFRVFIIVICIVSSQLSPINCNVIKSNDLSERPVVGKVIMAKSHSNVPIDHKTANVPTITRPILRHRSSELNYLTGLSSMPHQNLMAINRKPITPNIYQMPLSDASKNYYSVQQTPNDFNSNIIENPFKKYDLKKIFLKKIFGQSYEEEKEHEDGFFSGQHLKRHGAAGMAAKVFGELIGIKIRESIEDVGKTISNYAKDFTTRSFESIGNTFKKVLKV